MLVQVLFILWSITPLHFLLVYMATLGSQIPLSALMCFIWFGKWGFPDSSAGKESACNARDPGLISGSGRSSGERIDYRLQYSWASLVAQMVKNLLAMWEIWVWSMCWEDLLEKGKATHSTILAWKIPWTEEPGGLQSMGLHGSDTTEQLTTQHITRVLRMWVTSFPLNHATLRSISGFFAIFFLLKPVFSSQRWSPFGESNSQFSVSIICDF